LSSLSEQDFLVVRMVPVHGAVHSDRGEFLVHFVEQHGQTGGHQIRRPFGHALAYVPHVEAIDHGWVFDAHFDQNLTCCYAAFFVSIDNGHSETCGVIIIFNCHRERPQEQIYINNITVI